MRRYNFLFLPISAAALFHLVILILLPKNIFPPKSPPIQFSSLSAKKVGPNYYIIYILAKCSSTIFLLHSSSSIFLIFLRKNLNLIYIHTGASSWQNFFFLLKKKASSCTRAHSSCTTTLLQFFCNYLVINFVILFLLSFFLPNNPKPPLPPRCTSTIIDVYTCSAHNISIILQILFFLNPSLLILFSTSATCNIYKNRA